MIVDEMNEALEATLISHYGNTFGQKYFMTKGKQTTNLASIIRQSILKQAFSGKLV